MMKEHEFIDESYEAYGLISTQSFIPQIDGIFSTDALKLLEIKHNTTDAFITTNSTSLDSLIGGIPLAQVTEICGMSGTGKVISSLILLDTCEHIVYT
jgi:predicted ATP-dependent serine protease